MLKQSHYLTRAGAPRRGGLVREIGYRERGRFDKPSADAVQSLNAKWRSRAASREALRAEQQRALESLAAECGVSADKLRLTAQVAKLQTAWKG